MSTRVPWTAEEIAIIAEEYFYVLRAEQAGEKVVKVDAIRRAQRALPNERTEHTIKDRFYRISEELWKRDLPWVQGWKPPTLVNQQPNTENVGRTIWSAIEPFTTRVETERVSSE